MTAAEVFRRILGAVESAGIPYMLTGSFASSYHGAPRATQDIDLVIAPVRAQLHGLAALLPAPEFYMDEATALEPYDSEGQFNVVDVGGGAPGGRRGIVPAGASVPASGRARARVPRCLGAGRRDGSRRARQ